MKTHVNCWDIGHCRGTQNVVDAINRYAETHKLEIVGITYASGDIIVVFKEEYNEQR